MDRRVVACLAIALMGGPASAFAQALPGQKDPSGQPPVGLTDLPSIADTINSPTGFPRVAPPASPSPLNSPVGYGPPGALPRTPTLAEPIQIRPFESIGASINRGTRSLWPSSMSLRGLGSRPDAPPRDLARPKVDPATVRSRATSPIPTPTTTGTETGPIVLPPLPGERPAPFADRKPEGPRPRAELGVNPPSAPTAEPSAPDPAPAPAGPPGLPVLPTDLPVPAPGGPPPTVEPTVPTTPGPTPPALDEPAGLPPLTASPMPMPEAAPVVAESAPVADPAVRRTSLEGPDRARVDPAVARSSGDPTALRLKKPRTAPMAMVSVRAAAVGDEIITYGELESLVTDRYYKVVSPQEHASMTEYARGTKMQEIAEEVLPMLIEQALVINELNHKLKNNKKFSEVFNEFVEKSWRDNELPTLMRMTASANVAELRAKMSKEGQSYEKLKSSFRKKTMFREFMNMEIRNQVTCDLAEMRAYYNDHLKDYDKPERMSWREIEVKVAKHRTRAEAKAKADELLARLLRDEDFATVAKQASDGPTARDGGLYADFQPGNYRISAVNDELTRLPVGQVSRVIEAPESFFIVRVDEHREKGPLRFDEVQDKIRGKVLEQNYQKAVEGYLAKLRAKTLVRTMFDPPETPTRQQANALR